MRFLVLCAALALAGCQATPAPTATAAAPQAPVAAPAGDVPAGLAAFSGTWAGTWRTANRADVKGTLVVQDIAPNGDVTARYAWGRLPDGAEPGSGEARGHIEDKVLTVRTPGGAALATFAMQPNGTLYATYVPMKLQTTGIFARQ